MQLAVFKFNETSFTLLGTPEAPLFVATEVCAFLEYANPWKAIADHVDDEDKFYVNRDGNVVATRAEAAAAPVLRRQGLFLIPEPATPLTKREGGVSPESGTSRLVITESGVWTLALRSKKPNARPLVRYVTSVVLPSIRKTGAYSDTSASVEKLIADLSAFDLTEETKARLVTMRYEASQGRKPKVPTVKCNRPAPARNGRRSGADGSDPRPAPVIMEHPNVVLVRRWLADKTQPSAQRTAATPLYQSFVEWCDLNRELRIPIQTWGNAMRKAGIARTKNNGSTYNLSIKSGGGPR